MAMYCTEAESSFRPASSLDLFSYGPSHSQSSPPQRVTDAMGCGFPDANQPALQEEDLIGRLDESCISDANSTSHSAVDCTLSLGTPSTRVSTAKQVFMEKPPLGTPFLGGQRWPHPSRANCSNISWFPLDSADMPFVKEGATLGRSHGNIYNQNTMSNGRVVHKSGRNGSENVSSTLRKCANCDTSTTPLWRNGPKGPKSLCNACGIRYKKEERRSAGVCTSTESHKNKSDNDIYDKGYNVLHRCCTDDNNSCLTWQGSSSCVYLQPSNIPMALPLPNTSSADEGPTMLFGRSGN